jgi:alpha-ketoglutarate-dependent taurine dioxygenase
MQLEALSKNMGLVVKSSNGEGLADLNVDDLTEGLRSTGALYFQGFGADVATFEDFTNRFSDDYMDNTGSGSYRATVDEKRDSTIQNVAYVYGVENQRTFPLPLHADRSYVKSQPEMMWFMCVVPAEVDGQTTVCDGIAIHEGLSQKAKDFFAQNRLKYIRHYTAEEWPVIFHTTNRDVVKRYCIDNDLNAEFNENDSLITNSFKSAVVKPKYSDKPAFVNSILIQLWQEEELGRTSSLLRVEDGSKIPDEIIDEVKQVSDELIIALPWQTGDLILVDNTRVMHGRRSFTDQEREIYVRMCRSVNW